MTTLLPPTTAAPAAAAPERPLAARPSLRDTVNQTLAMAWRATKKMRRNPEQFFDVTLQPVLFTAMFAYIFGGAVSGSVAEYLPLIIPGILAQTALTACMATGTQMREDMDKGVFDRFKSLPIARIAPLAGPMLADLIRYGTAATITILVGLAMGYRPGGGVGGVVAGWALTVFAGWSLSWIFCWLGTVARSAQAVQGIGMMIMFPLTFLSNAFVKVETLPSLAGGLRERQPGLARRDRGARPDERGHAHRRGRLGTARLRRGGGGLRAAGRTDLLAQDVTQSRRCRAARASTSRSGPRRSPYSSSTAARTPGACSSHSARARSHCIVGAKR
ncbi:ABC transporter permease [Nocardioides convexus]|uniref:ABC transporter permease n=1 Tax=Nocardioides convexus TaxID=2712224 RepID=UPI0024187CF8|nr:ABC transporter permease [Nocardioides convexus]